MALKNGANPGRGGRGSRGADRPATSVIVTVRNEVRAIEPLLVSLEAQTVPPDEVVVVDAGSDDGTWETLIDWQRSGRLPLRCMQQPGANISAGRNRAIAHARGPWIAATDAGVELSPGWLAAVTAPLAGGASLAAGFFESSPVGAFETALGAATLPERVDVDPERFLPSSRSCAFVKSAWEGAGGYPEWLDYCEDLVFDIRARAVAGPWVFAPEAEARFRPRSSLGAFVRQYYLYARGDGKAGLWPARHALRYGVYLVVVPGLAAAGATGSWAAGAALAAGAAAMLRVPYRRLVGQWDALTSRERAEAALWVPAIKVAGDVAKMAGYPVGVWWRLRQSPPAWRPQPRMSRT